MKIGLIGINMYVRSLNYACPLHAFAFQQFLLEHGINAVVIDYVPKNFDAFNLCHPTEYYDAKLEDCKKNLEKLPANASENERSKLERQISTFRRLRDNYQLVYKEREIRYEKYRSFVNHRLMRTRYTYNPAYLETSRLGIDCYICVTDIIWTKSNPSGYDPGYFLASTCMDNHWKIAYSASKLVVEDENDRQKTTAWIRDMDFVSVREDYLQRYLLDNVRTDIACVLDPVLLHGPAFYEELLHKPQEQGYVLLYYVVDVNPPVLQKAISYARDNHLKLVVLSDIPNVKQLVPPEDVDMSVHYDIGIEEWLGFIRYADCVFTNSFHCCCLSILFEKTFFAGRRDPDKITALLRPLGLENRIIDKSSALPDFIKDWRMVRERLKTRRENSEHFILNAIAIASQQPHPHKDYNAEKMLQQYTLYYNSGFPSASLDDSVLSEYRNRHGAFFFRPNSIEYLPDVGKVSNDGTARFHENVFLPKSKSRFLGYRLRVVVDNSHFYLLENSTFQKRADFYKNPKPLKIFQPGDFLPPLFLNRIKACVAEAVWENVDS